MPQVVQTGPKKETAQREPAGPNQLPSSPQSAIDTLIGSFRRPSFATRLIVFLVIFTAEWAPLTEIVHKGRGAGTLLQIAIAAGSFFLAISYIRAKDSFSHLRQEIGGAPVRWTLFGAHILALLTFVGLSVTTIGNRFLAGVAATGWYAAGLAAVVLLFLAFVPWKLAIAYVRASGYAWLLALGAGVVAWRAIGYLPYWNAALWNPTVDLLSKTTIDLTFNLVKALLGFLLPVVIADHSTMIIGSPNFHVILLPWCAGFEGLALMLVFSTAWLAYFRREYRFPNALLLVPAGMLVIWLSNAVRITALILIGVAGFRDVAAGGFHSQAGWIAFNVVALGFAVVSRRLPWFTYSSVEERTKPAPGANATAVYLVPFLAIMAAAMLARAASGTFEWLYPLRFAAAIGALWFFRSEYQRMDWRFGGFAVAAGCAVFALWIGLDRMSAHHSASAIGNGLAALSAPFRLTWITVRTLAAVITVPIAEELAFRGFLIRRVSSADFDLLSGRYYTWAGLVVSSLAFGLLHGDRWLAGTLAGLIYAAAFVRRGRIGDAVVAHGTTNALLAAYVLLAGRWDLW